ncbi:MAG: hypothetical protein K2O97_13605, partial [Acetatifactor sp.]|nr:hypothetical protein [Acetatifactor sp.]
LHHSLYPSYHLSIEQISPAGNEQCRKIKVQAAGGSLLTKDRNCMNITAACVYRKEDLYE